ncbi:thioesterase II family protein [Micromonospora sp. NPDC049275]|uniref:thioesterase II family protein n=1 Tax=Micromonospora sp. NPDC049275 TaxID=3364268 RepID=UPI00371DFBFA
MRRRELIMGERVWTAVLRPASTSAYGRLVAIAHSASGPTSLMRLLRRLPAGIDVVGVTLPGRERRIAEGTAQLRVDPGGAVDAVLHELRGYPPLPTVLFGHSMGAAFATAMVLADRDVCAGLVVSGHPGCLSAGDLAPPTWTEGELLDLLRVGGGTPAELLADPVIRAYLLDLLRCDLTVARRLAIQNDGKRIPVPLTVLGGRQDSLVTMAQLRAWATRAPYGVRQRLFPGGHFYLLDEANVEPVAAEISAAFPPPEPVAATAATLPARVPNGADPDG